jgi:hypothetical protein
LKLFQESGGEMKDSSGGGESSIIYLIHYKNLCKCHNIPPHSTKIEVKNKIKCTFFFRKKEKK